MAADARIVLVDDDPSLLSELRAVLEECGLGVVGTADNGEAGIELIERLRPDIAILDVRMPGLSGTEAAVILRERHPDLAVILLSAYDDEGIQQAARAASVAGYVVKGAPIRELLSIVTPIVEGLNR